MELKRARGAEDFKPEKKILRNNIVETLKKVFENYGFDPLETPILERYSTLSRKYAGGSEILKETFKLKDQGKRELGLRYDLTVPLARFVAMNKDISFPFKRYQIEKVFRDGPITRARIREFIQKNGCSCTFECGLGASIAFEPKNFKFALPIYWKIFSR